MVEQLSPTQHRPDRPERDEPSDLAIGAFTPDGPWTVDPAAMRWRFAQGDEGDIDQLRRDAAALARQLVRPRRLPPGVRVVTVGYRLGSALLGWGLRDRGTPNSR